MYLCDRPHPKTIDFAASRFVVAKECGLVINGHTFARGQEVPPGYLTPEALRLEYEAPIARIELVEFAAQDPALGEACARHGVPGFGPQKEADPASQPEPASLASRPRSELARHCESLGLPSDGTKKQLAERILAHLAATRPGS